MSREGGDGRKELVIPMFLCEEEGYIEGERVFTVEEIKRLRTELVKSSKKND